MASDSLMALAEQWERHAAAWDADGKGDFAVVYRGAARDLRSVLTVAAVPSLTGERLAQILWNEKMAGDLFAEDFSDSDAHTLAAIILDQLGGPVPEGPHTAEQAIAAAAHIVESYGSSRAHLGEGGIEHHVAKSIAKDIREH